MFSALRWRLTFWYAGVAALLFTMLGISTTVLVLREVSHATAQQISVAARDVRLHGTAVIPRYRNSGLKFFVVRFPGRGPRGIPPPPHRPPPFDRLTAVAYALFGLHPEEVPIPQGRVVIAPEPSRAMLQVRTIFGALLAGIAVATLLAWLTARYLAAQALRPLENTARALEALAGGNFDLRRISDNAKGELGRLALTFDRASATVRDALEERRRAEERMRQFIADAGHQLRTPLTVIIGYLEVLRKNGVPPVPTYERILDIMDSEGQRMRRLVDQLLVLARMDRLEEPPMEPVDITDVVSRIVESLSLHPGIPLIEYDAEATATIVANEAEIYEALSNIVDNAVKYGEGQPITIRSSIDGDAVIVTVEDRGPGIPEAERVLAFDRFYRGSTGTYQAGAGLGLTIAKRAVERAEGTIRFEDAVPSGTRVVLRFPLARPLEFQGQSQDSLISL